MTENWAMSRSQKFREEIKVAKKQEKRLSLLQSAKCKVIRSIMEYYITVKISKGEL